MTTSWNPTPDERRAASVASGDDKQLIAVDAATGDEQWHFDGPQIFGLSAPVIVEDRLYVGNDSGTIYAFLLTAIDPFAFGIEESIFIITLVIVGGTGTRLNVTDFLWRGAERVACNGAGPPATGGGRRDRWRKSGGPPG